MPKLVLPLTEAEIKAAKPGLKKYQKYDGKGLYLDVDPSGGKWWRIKYRFEGKEKRISLGVYPDVGLKDARERREACRMQIANGIDPSANRKTVNLARADRAENSFEVVAREWLGKFIDPMSDSHKDRVYARFINDVFPQIGGRPIAEITPPELLSMLRRIEDRGADDTAHRTLGSCGQVFRYGISTGRCERDISHDLRGALNPLVEHHFAAATEPTQIVEILRVVDGYKGTFIVQSALRLAPLVFVRPGELRAAKWADIDLDEAEWLLTLSKQRTSKKKASDKPGDQKLMVPLSRQSLEILRKLYSLTGRGIYVFPGARTDKRPMSENAVLAAMRRMGIGKDEMCGHGFRATARTILAQDLHVRPDLIEQELGHQVIDPNGRAYNRTTFLPERRLMLQVWADYLDNLKDGGEMRPKKEVRLTDIRSIMIGNYD